jgi:hypothetical protein
VFYKPKNLQKELFHSKLSTAFGIKQKISVIEWKVTKIPLHEYQNSLLFFWKANCARVYKQELDFSNLEQLRETVFLKVKVKVAGHDFRGVIYSFLVLTAVKSFIY